MLITKPRLENDMPTHETIMRQELRIAAEIEVSHKKRIAALEAELAKAKEENEDLAQERDQAAAKERRMIAEFLDVNYGIIPVAQIVDKIRAGKY